MRTPRNAPGVRPRASLLLAVVLLFPPNAARAHAQLERADPKVGSTVAGSPGQVRIWFDSDLDPASSSIAVRAQDGGRVDEGAARVDPSDPKLLGVAVPPLVPGTYQVAWSVTATDGHHSSGHYRFTVK